MRSRSLVTLLSTLIVWTGCGEDQLSGVDAGTDAGPSDVTADAGLVDVGTGDVGADAGVSTCELAGNGQAASPAALTGRIDVIDYDVWDELGGARSRVRNAGINFRTLTLPVLPLSDGALFVSIPIDDCVAFDLPPFTTNTGPPRNVGTQIEITDGMGTTIRLDRTSGSAGVEYEFASQEDLVGFFDPDVLRFDRAWTYSTPGDSASGIRPAKATVSALSDFEVQPALTSTTAAVTLDPNGTELTWTASGVTGALSIVLARALDAEGRARYLVCRPNDDGAFTIEPGQLAAFGAVPGLAFDLAVSRSVVAPFCNEGVIAGAISHSIVYLGLGVLP